MVKIKSIRIENFQSHKNTYMNLSEGLNVITGPSDQGKTAVIRAIKWVLYNEPRGTDFIRYGASYARVTLEFNDGKKIIRERSKSKNRYIIVNTDGTDMILEGFGNEVPREVIEIHSSPVVELDTGIRSTINIAEQLEGPFLLSESGSVRAKAIGRFAGLHIIDRAIKMSTTDLRRQSLTRERVKNDLKSIERKIEEFGQLETIREKIELLDKEYLLQLKKKIDLFDRLSWYSHKLKKVELDSKILSNLLNKTGNFNRYEEIIKEIEKKAELYRKCSKIKEKYDKILKDIENVQSHLKSNSEKMEKMIGDLTGILNETGQCPLCKSRISESILSNIIKYYKEI